ncbi:MAG TPA: 2-oxoglutarate dehydrogenase E1 component [Gammaproteobacteria bacterium]|nr:2-oxoglutarate dehydrogenase E1 component [Gammaproteobacteria bacterium]
MQQASTMKEMWASSALAGSNASYIEELFEKYLEDSESVPYEWQELFNNLPKIKGGDGDVSHQAILQDLKHIASHKKISLITPQAKDYHSVTLEHERKQIQVLRLIQAYRLQGHLHAQINPLGFRELETVYSTELSLEDHGLSVNDLGITFDVETFVGPKQMTLGQLYYALTNTYCGSIGTEYMHIPYQEEREWIQHRIEAARGAPIYTNEVKVKILERLIAAEGLEKYLGSKYPGAKRFSLEGGDALIVILDELIQRAGTHKAREVIMAMAHRGRLNVLINVLGKKASDLFDEFEGKYFANLESGDVKYHQGFSSDIATPGGNVHVALAFNPSHLEIVTPVMCGSVRSRQKRLNDPDHNKVLPIAIHGDAAFSGQGVVMETLNMSETRAYRIGGTVHIIVNNQIGFTTSIRQDARSTLYCSDVAKVVLAPIFHVNADDPEAVLFVTQLALDYRMRFNKDVVIDLVCYRRHGHNEADEPAATQPKMYKKIRKHPTVVEVYAKNLILQGILTEEDVEHHVEKNRARLDKGECVASNIVTGLVSDYAIDWTPYFSFDWRAKVKTKIDKSTFQRIAEQMVKLPENFELHPRVKKIFEDRKRMGQGEILCDWGFAETLAYASLCDQCIQVRITGQDVGRGTFFHRHAILHDQKTGEVYIPIANVNSNQGKFEIYDSLLSEEAVLAFEYGYSTTDPSALVVWEAQFGDFANGAQVVIDQFISSGQQKWGRLCGLVMLLPHGYEGQGPEHSSARLERFLQLCAELNIQVCVPTTASQVFHMLRRQILRKIRTPLIVMSPKSLLRHKEASSDIQEFIHGEFKLIIPENHDLDKDKVTKIVLCAGKVYYDLREERNKKEKFYIAIIRIEQLYPFPEDELRKEIAQYKNVEVVVWCQEEPKNQGAWYSQQHHFISCISNKQTLVYAGRPASAAPAVGYLKAHTEQQSALIEEALA